MDVHLTGEYDMRVVYRPDLIPAGMERDGFRVLVNMDMRTVMLVGPTTIHTFDLDSSSRDRFIEGYCAAKGYDPDEA